MSENKIIAVYGTLRTDCKNHHFAAGAISNQPCTITGTLYDTGYGFPAFELEGNTEIVAELIEVTAQDFANIEKLEGYPNLYRHQQIPATLPDGSNVQAWVYIMNRLPEHATVIKSGDWKKR
jgi:gamma-glutamylcyclotransferase (GGCT)/AIG2-like uncharacterized protein YtfP